MLVLSRREDQKILFPGLGISVEVVNIEGGKVKLGVEAPPSIRILRDELLDRSGENPTALDNSSEERHRLNNHLNAFSLKLQLAEKSIRCGQTEAGLAIFDLVLQELSQLNEPLQSRNAGSRDSQRRFHALLVEDNANERELLSKVLEMSGIAVVSVTDGEQAIDYLEDNELPDVILIDMQMPRLNGPETISIIRERLKMKSLPIYGVSGSNRKELNVPFGDRGVSRWFAKPVQADQIVCSINMDCCRLSSLN